MRLMDRVPSAELVEISSLEGYRLTFHKKSTDGSSKCNIFEAEKENDIVYGAIYKICLLYTSPSPRDATLSRMPSSA